jgi:hypothetical protein
MNRIALCLAVVAAGLSGAGVVQAQTFPVVAGTLEFQGGMAAVALPEENVGSISAQPELRIGYFFMEGVEAQVVGDGRVWPLGNTAPSFYGVTGNVLWFPNLGPRSRNLYFLGGGGGVLVDPPSPTVDSSIDPLLRAGMGIKISLAEIGWTFLHPFHLTVEFREEVLFGDETDFLSGVSFGLSSFR